MEKKSVTIALWSVCGVLLFVVIVLTFILFNRRRLRSKTQPKKITGWSSGLYSYVGYQRCNQLELGSSPTQGTYDEAQVVHIYIESNAPINRAAHPHTTSDNAKNVPNLQNENITTSPNAVCDVLVNILFMTPSSDAATLVPVAADSRITLASDEKYYRDKNFLLYTSPLQFVEPGIYVVQAYTVRPAERVLGAVHQFVFTILSHTMAVTANSDGETVRNTALTIPSSSSFNQKPRNMYHTPISHAESLINTDSMCAASLPPHIIPDRGDITTVTHITITPNEHSTTPDQLRYSVDGTYPTLLYNSPFTLSLPPASVLPEQHMTVVIKAVALTMHSSTVNENTCSLVAQAILHVHHASYSFLDVGMPAPSIRVHALDAKLYFDESNNPPRTQTVYRLLTVDQARHKIKFSPHTVRVYRGEAIPILEDVALIYAWTVSTSSIQHEPMTHTSWIATQSASAHIPDKTDTTDVDARREYTAMRYGTALSETAIHSSTDGLVYSDDDETGASSSQQVRNGRYQRTGNDTWLRSAATVYDCFIGAVRHAKPNAKRLASAAKEAAVSHRWRDVHSRSSSTVMKDRDGSSAIAPEEDSDNQSRFLPSPVPCISCKEMDVEFDDPPAHGIIVYTLNNREPVLYDVNPPASAAPLSHHHSNAGGERESELEADVGGLHTHIYRPGSRIRVTLLETDNVYMTARIFIPIYSDVSSSGTAVGSSSAYLSNQSGADNDRGDLLIGGGNGGAQTGRLLSYRYSNAFRRGFFLACGEGEQ